MIVWAPPERPVEFALGFLDGQVVDEREAMLHQAVRAEFPILVERNQLPEPSCHS